jgi:diadenosine tetraphosphate (Ap4A) HIT family hydrolase
MYRNRHNSKKYIGRKHEPKCSLCLLHNFELVENNNHTVIVKNNYPYDIWEGCTVVEHLMIVPKAHGASLADLPAETKSEILASMAKYESNGYDVYARSRGSVHRSVSHHQHTHLIKTQGNSAKLIIYIQKPYYLKKI